MLLPRFEVATDWSHAAPSSHFFVKGIKWCCCEQNVILSSIVAFKWIDSFISVNAEIKKNVAGVKPNWFNYLLCVIQLKNKQQKWTQRTREISVRWCQNEPHYCFETTKSSEYDAKNAYIFFFFTLFWCPDFCYSSVVINYFFPFSRCERWKKEGWRGPKSDFPRSWTAIAGVLAKLSSTA